MGCKYGGFIRRFREYFQNRRTAAFAVLFPPHTLRTVIDVGGTPEWWNRLNSAAHVTLVNSDARELDGADRYTAVVGDGRNLQFASAVFDLAFSNSVIEHVGGLNDMDRFSRELRRVGKSYYCQTPNKWFPIEPHLGTVFLHWFPGLLRNYLVVRYLTLWGLLNKPTRQTAKDSIANIHLISRRQLEEFFPDADIVPERFLGLPKSYIAIRRSAG
jgi:hypothetical protein